MFFIQVYKFVLKISNMNIIDKKWIKKLVTNTKVPKMN